ncbi:hypothetical protein N7468_008990 [Penicillium chermesinum]|uniref:Uncharacterized protein n=1 Tax=Penicillium chermesinum TaxID=63820 RepID=A0A9W9TEK8_9EURO|nr:uncharacterized protein N7468_008990 [Penicillium chermesinum]KAJ5219786.1 hypothetical protein N7468_008990 [Penicillium chermesinum]
MSSDPEKPKIDAPAAPTEAHSETQVEVDTLILDYLTCIAIEKILTFILDQGTETSEELDWAVRPVQGFQRSQFPDPEGGLLTEDVQIKTRILAVADGLRKHTHTEAPDRKALPALGLEFLELCATVVERVSKKRWFDVGALWIYLATKEYQYGDDVSPSEDLLKLCSWVPNDPGLSLRWAQVRWKYVSEPSNPGDIPYRLPILATTSRQTCREFLYDLMATLDAPILIQLERGKLGDLTRAETQDLLNRVFTM